MYSKQIGGTLVILGIIAAAALFGPDILPDNVLWRGKGASVKVSSSMSGNYLAAEYAFKHRDFKDASLLFIESLHKAPGNVKILENAYLMLLLSGQVDKALELVQHSPGTHPPVISNTLLALKAFREGNYSKARTILQTMPRDKAAIDAVITPFLVSWCDAGERKYTEALSRLRNLLESNGNRAFVAYQMALIDDIAGLNEEAGKNFSLALKGAENSYRFIKAAGNFYERTGQREKAARLYKDYTEDNISSGIFKKEIERVSRKEPIIPARVVSNAAEGISQILLEVASGFYKEHLYTEAQIYLQMVLYLDPSSSQAHFLLANYYESNQDFNEAISHYQEIEKNSDFYWQSQVNIALGLFKLGDLQAARKHLLSLSKLRPSDYEVLLILADILRSESQLQEAITIYNQILSTAVKPPPHYWYAFYMRAISYDQAQMQSKAEADLLQALALNPDQEEVLNYLGYNWINAGKNIPKAKKMIAKALENQPDNPQFIDSMGWALFAEKDYAKAISYLEVALELLPNDPTINDHLGDAYYKEGRVMEAIFQWQRALGFSPQAKDAEKIKAKLDNPKTALR